MADNPSYAAVCVFGRVSVFRMNRDAAKNYAAIADGPGRRTALTIPGARATVVSDPSGTTVLVLWKNQLVQVNAFERIRAPGPLARLILNHLEKLPTSNR